MLWVPVALIGSAGLFFLAQNGFSQPGRSGGSSGRGGFDPNEMFNRYSGGADVINIADVASRSSRPGTMERMQAYAERNGIRDGKLTRDQFTGYVQEMMQSFGKGGPPSGVPGGPPPGGSEGDRGGDRGGSDCEEGRLRDYFRSRIATTTAC